MYNGLGFTVVDGFFIVRQAVIVDGAVARRGDWIGNEGRLESMRDGAQRFHNLTEVRRAFTGKTIVEDKTEGE